jgi:dihydrofolate reductase
LIVSLLVAQDEKGGIGKNNQLPWILSSDLRRFKRLTMGHHLIMGRRTYETIGKPLPGRTMIIVTHNRNYFAEGCIIAHALDEALNIAKEQNETEVFIIGGGDIFSQSIHLVNRIYLTIVHAVTKSDVFFPEVDDSEWVETYCEVYPKSENDEFASDFKILERKY